MVTGAGGWLGRALLDQLTGDGPHGRPGRVRALVTSGDDATTLAALPRVDPVVGDIRRPDGLRELFADLDGTVDVIHTAGVIHPERVADFREVNARGTEHVLSFAAARGVRRVVHVSSNSPFGTNATPTDTFRNDEPYAPYYGYGRSKMQAELRLLDAVAGGLDAVIVRPPWFYGPFQPARQTTFFRLVRTGRFPVIGDGRQRRSMVHVDNLVQGIVRAELTVTPPGRGWWIADAEPYEVNEIVATVGRALAAEGFDVVPNRVRLPPIAGRLAERADAVLQRAGRYVQQVHVLGEMDKTIACDISAARSELGYEPTIALEEGMRQSIRWCVAQGLVVVTTSLVTGGNGYFGQLVVDRLVARGDRVRLLDIDVAGAERAGVEVVAADIRDAAAVRAAVDGVDVVFHNVAQVPLARDAELLRTVNVDGTGNLLDACRDAGVGKVVHTSSSAVFGIPESNPVLPTTVPRPQEAYGHAKLAAEWACLQAAATGLDVTIVRPRTILGHGRLGIFGILFDWIADGADPIVLGDGTNRYQFIHADDLATVCLLAAERGGPAVFNAGTDRFGTMREALDHLCAHAGTGATVRSLPAGPTALAMRATARLGLTPFAPYHWLMYARSMWFDLDHVRDALGWSPRYSTDEMLAESYDWFLAHRAEAASGTGSPHRRVAKSGILGLAKRLTPLLPRAR